MCIICKRRKEKKREEKRREEKRREEKRREENLYDVILSRKPSACVSKDLNNEHFSRFFASSKITKSALGFTLAEVLVTLAVIGVVAALTIPGLMQNIQNAGVASRVKKANSMLNQAVKMYMVDNDCVGDLAACGAFAGDENDSGHQQAGDALKPYFKVVKDCGIARSEGGCFPKDVMYKLLNGKDYEILDSEMGAKAVLSDGALIYIYEYTGNCTSDHSQAEPPNESALEYCCGKFFIDINGKKGPNQFGRDTFEWRITKSGVIYPVGSLDDHPFAAADGTPDCDPDDDGDMSTPGGGRGCAARIMQEGKVNY